MTPRSIWRHHDAANQMRFGTATATRMTRRASTVASTAAQSGPTQIVTSDASGNLATAGVNSLLENSTAFKGFVRRRVMAIAMGGGATTLPPGQNFDIGVNWGTFDGQNAVGITGVARLYDNLRALVSAHWLWRQSERALAAPVVVSVMPFPVTCKKARVGQSDGLSKVIDWPATRPQAGRSLSRCEIPRPSVPAGRVMDLKQDRSAFATVTAVKLIPKPQRANLGTFCLQGVKDRVVARRSRDGVKRLPASTAGGQADATDRTWRD